MSCFSLFSLQIMAKPAADKHYDLIVIGGGSAAFGVALAAKERGLKTALFEKGGFFQATSANHLRIMHGGFRYFQNLDPARIVESIRAQSYWLKEAADLIRPLPCLMPLSRCGLKSRYPLWIVKELYQALYRRFGFTAYAGASLESSEFVRQKLPLLAELAPYGVLQWHDALVEDLEDFNRRLVRYSSGPTVALFEHTEVKSLELGEPEAVVVAAGPDGNSEFFGKVIVNAAGPWIERLRPKAVVASAPRLRWCLAFNLVLDKLLVKEYAVGVSGSEGRLFFLTPRSDRSALGTFHTPEVSSPDQIEVPEDEVQAAITSFQRAWPSLGFSRINVQSLEAGIIPVRGFRGREPVFYGAERIFSFGRYLEVVSTKYTTFRSLGEKVAGQVAALLGVEKPR